MFGLENKNSRLGMINAENVELPATSLKTRACISTASTDCTVIIMSNDVTPTIAKLSLTAITTSDLTRNFTFSDIL